MSDGRVPRTFRSRHIACRDSRRHGSRVTANAGRQVRLADQVAGLDEVDYSARSALADW